MIAPLAIGVVVLAGCGRIGFDPDSARTADTAGDAMPVAGLLAHFTFDDNPSDGADNAVIGAPKAACVSTCPIRTVDRHGMLNAYQFNGTTDSLRYPDSPELRTAQGTAAMWVRFARYPAFDVYMVVASKPFGALQSNSWELYLHRGAVLQGNVGGDSTGTSNYARITWTLPLDTWLHFAMTWGTSVRQYVNGNLVAEVSDVGHSFDGGHVYLGSDFDSGTIDSLMEGALDDVYLFSVELTAPEIAQLAVP